MYGCHSVSYTVALAPKHPAPKSRPSRDPTCCTPGDETRREEAVQLGGGRGSKSVAVGRGGGGGSAGVSELAVMAIFHLSS